MVDGGRDFLAGRTALVTGAGNGLGRGIAAGLAVLGANVCVNDLNPDRAGAVAQTIINSGGNAFAWQADISNKFQAAGLIEATRDRYHKLDIVVNAAHVHPSTPILLMDEWDWLRTVEVNLTGAFLVSQLAARVMADEQGGLVLLVIRHMADRQPADSATLAGALALAQAMDLGIDSQNVRVRPVHLIDSQQSPMQSVEAICREHFL